MAGFPHHALEHLSPQAAARRPSRRHLRPGRRPGPGQGAGQARSHPRRHARHAHRRRPARSAPGQPPRRPAAAGRRSGRSAWPGWSCPRASSRPPTCRATAWPTSWAGWRRPMLCAESAGRAEIGRAAGPAARAALPQLTVTAAAGLDLRPGLGPGRAVPPLRRHHAGRLRLRRRPALPGRRRGPAAVPARNAQGQPGPPHAGCGRYRRGPLPVPRRSDAPQPGADAHPARRRPQRLAAGGHRPHRHADGRPAAARMARRRRWPTAPPSTPGWTPWPSCTTSTALRQELRDALGEAFDLQRLTARVSTGRASPRDLAAVGRTLAPACRASRPR